MRICTHKGVLRRCVVFAVLLLLVACASPLPPDGTPTPDPGAWRTPPVPGIAFPRQEPIEGTRTYMTAALFGTLVEADGCLWVNALHGEGRVLPIWPPEFSLIEQDGRLLVINQSIPISGSGSVQEQVVAAIGEEVAMGGGHVSHLSDAVLVQIPPACQGAYFLVGQPESVRPNLREHSELYTWEMASAGDRNALILRYTPTFAALAGERQEIAGELVLYENQRCLQLQTGQGPGPITLLLPPDWAARFGEGEQSGEILDGAQGVAARLDERITVHGRPIVQDWASEIYQRAVQELPFDCCCTFWLVEEIE